MEADEQIVAGLACGLTYQELVARHFRDQARERRGHGLDALANILGIAFDERNEFGEVRAAWLETLREHQVCVWLRCREWWIALRAYRQALTSGEHVVDIAIHERR